MTFTKKLLVILVENGSRTFKAQDYFRKALLYFLKIIQNTGIMMYVCSFCKQFLLTGLCDWKSLEKTVLNKHHDFNLRFITRFIFLSLVPNKNQKSLLK